MDQYYHLDLNSVCVPSCEKFVAAAGCIEQLLGKTMVVAMRQVFDAAPTCPE